jgi:hypothetical protein
MRIQLIAETLQTYMSALSIPDSPTQRSVILFTQCQNIWPEGGEPALSFP